MWERDTSGECSNEDNGSTAISGGSNNHTIRELEEDSAYTITVRACNAAGSTVSDSVSVVTGEAGKYIYYSTRAVEPC